MKCADLIGLLCLLLGFSGCMTTAVNIETASELSRVDKSRSIVFGRIEWFENGKEKEFGKGPLAFSVTPHLMKMEDKSRIIGEVDKEGRFVWSLEKGIYLIHKMAYRDPWSGNYFIVPKVAFRVPEGGGVVYIGILRGEFQPKRDLIGGLSGKVDFTVEDEFDRDSSNYQRAFGGSSKIIESSLMIQSSRLPETVETTAEFNLAVSIINAILYGVSQ